MNNIIQQVSISLDTNLFIIDFDIESNKLTFRTSFEPKYKQEEVITINEDLVYTNLYHFPIGYLHKFITENNLIIGE